MSIEAMKLALEALELWCPAMGHALNKRAEAVVALRAAIEEEEKPWVKTYAGGRPNYTTQPRREWQGLTEKEICPWFQENTALTNEAAMRITRAIEAKLRERNT